LFLYTGLVSSDNLKGFLFELYDLSAHFGVEALRNACLQELYDSWSTINEEIILSFASTRTSDLHLATMFAASIADHFSEFVKKSFPFHKIGRTMLPMVFKRMGESRDLHHDNDYSDF
jgi:hypothetical protein